MQKDKDETKKAAQPKDQPKKREMWSFPVTDADLEEYEKERLAGIEANAQYVRKKGLSVEDKGLVLPKLNPDGSLTEEERQKVRQKQAGSKDAWGGEAKQVD